MFFFLNTLINHLIYIDVIIRIEKLLVQNLNVVRLIRNKGRRKIRRGSERILTKKTRWFRVWSRSGWIYEMKCKLNQAERIQKRCEQIVPSRGFFTSFLLSSYYLRFHFGLPIIRA